MSAVQGVNMVDTSLHQKKRDREMKKMAEDADSCSDSDGERILLGKTAELSGSTESTPRRHSIDDDLKTEQMIWWKNVGTLPIWWLVLKRSAPTVLSLLSYMMNETVNMIMIGHAPHTTPAQLAAVGLGNVIQNVTAFSVVFGLLNALDTMISQSWAAGRMDIACSQLMQARMVSTCAFLIIAPIFWYTESILLLLRMDPIVSVHAGEYCRMCVFGILPVFFTEIVRKLLQNLERPEPATAVLMITSVLHVFWSYLFVMKFEYNNFGLGLANTITWITSAVLLHMYVWANAKNLGIDERWRLLSFNGCNIAGFVEFLKLGYPCLVQSVSEWWYWELISIVVGWLDPVSLAAHTGLMITIQSVTYMFSLGIATTATTLVGGAIGSNDVPLAKELSAVSFYMMVSLWVFVFFIPLFFTPTFVSNIVTENEDVVTVLSPLVQLFAFVGFFDLCGTVLCGCLRSLGATADSSTIYLISNYGIMLPFGVIFAFPMQSGVYGVWVGTLIGCIVLFFLMWRRMNLVDFDGVVDESAQRIERAGNTLDESNTI